MSARNSSSERDSESRLVRGERLAERRRHVRRRASIALLVLALLLLVGAWWGVWQRAVRISRVTVFAAPPAGDSGGATSDEIRAAALAAIQGAYVGLIPRDSVFFVPEHDIRSRILGLDDRLASVSLFREGFDGLSIKVDERTPVARWCGSTFENISRLNLDKTASSTRSNLVAPGGCYLFDAGGFVFAAATSSDQTLNPFILYAPLAASTPGPLEAAPIGATIAGADALPPLFDFARQTGMFGSPVATIAVRGDEVDDFLRSGTRITYVAGQEQDAFAALTSAKGDLNLADGSLEYVDLRFPGKVYFKKKGL